MSKFLSCTGERVFKSLVEAIHKIQHLQNESLLQKLGRKSQFMLKKFPRAYHPLNLKVDRYFFLKK